MVPRAWCWRVHGALTQKVNAIEAINDRFHAACEGIQSGQLPVLGLWHCANGVCATRAFGEGCFYDLPGAACTSASARHRSAQAAAL
jgi:hypothetical protein